MSYRVSMSMSVSMSFDIKIDISEMYRKHLTSAQCRYMSITEQTAVINRSYLCNT